MKFPDSKSAYGRPLSIFPAAFIDAWAHLALIAEAAAKARKKA